MCCNSLHDREALGKKKVTDIIASEIGRERDEISRTLVYV